MKLIKIFKGLTVAAAAFGILLPYPAITNASERARAQQQAETVRDVSLGAGGLLHGQVVNRDGLPDRQATVAVIRDGERVAAVKTDENGAFAIAGLSGGLYAISSGKASGVVRAWSHQTAPPAASQGVLLVPSDLTVRGQGCLHDWLRNQDGLRLAQIGLGGLVVLGLIGVVIAEAIEDDAS